MSFALYCAGFMQGMGVIIMPILNVYLGFVFILLGVYCIRLDRKIRELEEVGE